MAWGSRARAASHPRCSVARSQSAHRGTCTGTCSWGRRPGHSDRQNHPKRKQFPHELKEGDKYLVRTDTNSLLAMTNKDLRTLATHPNRCQSSCGCLSRIHTAALYVCHRGSFQSTPDLSDGHTPGSRRSHPGSGAPRGDTWGAPLGTGICEDTPGTRQV